MKRRINKNKEEEGKQETISLMDLQIPQGPPPLRTIGLFGDLDEEKVEDVCSGLLYLQHTSKVAMPGEEEPKVKPITFYVSTWGGDALGMFGIYDLMRMVREDCPIQTAGTKGERRIGKHCRVMMHAVRGGHVGSIHSLENEMEETRWIQRQHIRALCEETDLTERQLKKMLNKNLDVYLTAEEAVNYGIADIIV